MNFEAHVSTLLPLRMSYSSFAIPTTMSKAASKAAIASSAIPAAYLIAPDASCICRKDVEVALGACLLDRQMEHGQVRALDRAQVKSRVQSLLHAPPAGPVPVTLLQADIAGV